MVDFLARAKKPTIIYLEHSNTKSYYKKIIPRFLDEVLFYLLFYFWILFLHFWNKSGADWNEFSNNNVFF